MYINSSLTENSLKEEITLLTEKYNELNKLNEKFINVFL